MGSATVLHVPFKCTSQYIPRRRGNYSIFSAVTAVKLHSCDPDRSSFASGKVPLHPRSKPGPGPRLGPRLGRAQKSRTRSMFRASGVIARCRRSAAMPACRVSQSRREGWWRWRESNPRPKDFSKQSLQAYPIRSVSQTRRSNRQGRRAASPVLVSAEIPGRKPTPSLLSDVPAQPRRQDWRNVAALSSQS